MSYILPSFIFYLLIYLIFFLLKCIYIVLKTPVDNSVIPFLKLNELILLIEKYMENLLYVFNYHENLNHLEDFIVALRYFSL